MRLLFVLFTLTSLHLFASNSPTITLSPKTLTVKEESQHNTTQYLTLAISEAPDSQDIDITVYTSSLSANNDDYEPFSETYRFKKKTKTLSYEIPLIIKADELMESNEALSVTFNATSHKSQRYSLGNTESTVIIQSSTALTSNTPKLEIDMLEKTLYFSEHETSVKGEITVSINEAPSSAPITLTYTVFHIAGNEEANSYIYHQNSIQNSGTVTFAIDDVETKTIPITLEVNAHKKNATNYFMEFSATSDQQFSMEKSSLKIKVKPSKSSNEEEAENEDKSDDQTITPSTQGTFDAWDSFRTIANREISTKIVNKAFTLVLASMSQNNSEVITKPGITLVYYLKDFTSGEKIPTTQNRFDAGLDALITPTFTLNAAYRDVAVTFQACCTYDGNAYSLLDYDSCSQNCMSATNTTPCFRELYATDHFAVRPKIFDITFEESPTLQAGVPFAITFKALDETGAPALNYNQTYQNSFDINYSEINNACKTGILSTPSFSFSNGATSPIPMSYSEAGVISVAIAEKSSCNEQYAAIDCSDANVFGYWNVLSDLPIQSAVKQSVPFTPYRFALSALLHNHGNGFTYLSNNPDHAASLDIDLEAQQHDGNLTENYTESCYATNGELNITYETLFITQELLYTVPEYALQGEFPINTTVHITSLPKKLFQDFDKGRTKLTTLLNFKRSTSSPTEPFDLNISQLTYFDSDQISGSAPVDTLSHFLYARLYSPRYKAAGPEAITTFYYEYFCTNNCSSSSQQSNDSVHWYINSAHDTHSDGNITSTQTYDPSLQSAFSEMQLFNNAHNGRYLYNQVKGYPFKATMQLNTQHWLIYNQHDPSAVAYYFQLEFYKTKESKGFETDSSAQTKQRVMW